MKRTTTITRTVPPENFEAEADRLFHLRTDLNGYVNALHKKYSFGFSLFECFSVDAALKIIDTEIRFSNETIENLTTNDVSIWNDIAGELQAAGSLLPQPYNHPLVPVDIRSYSQQLKADSRDLLHKFITEVGELRAYTNAVSSKLHIGASITSSDQLEALNTLSRLLLTLPNTAPELFAIDNPEQSLNKMMTTCEHGLQRDALRRELLAEYQPSILALDAEQTLQDWNTASHTWFLPKYFKQSAIKKMLKKQARSKPSDPDFVTPLLNKIVAYHMEQAIVDKQSDFLMPLLGFMWLGGDCDWTQLSLISKTIIQLNREILLITGSTIKAKEWRKRISAELSEGASNFHTLHGQNIKYFTESWLAVDAKKARLKETLGIAFLDLKHVSENYFDHLETISSQVYDSINQLKDWISWLAAKDKALEAGLAPVVSEYETGKIKSADVVLAFKKGLYRSSANFIIEKEPVLALFNGKLFEEKIDRFRQMSHYFEQLTKQELYAKLAARIPDFTREGSQTSEISILQKTIGNKGRSMPIRKLFDAIPNLLPRITPCMLMSPISVAQYFDAGGPKFDLVVFDEASQMPTCEAVGAIARANNMIIVGDPKQMPPTSFFSSNSVDEDNMDKEDLESILDDCLALSIPSRNLLWHYRSKHESLIAFSNSKYYENKLLTFPSPDDIATKVTCVPVEGYYDRGKTRQNSFEAKAVIEEIKRRLSDPLLSKRSIGVVTFSSVQQTLIQNLFDELLRSNPHLESIALDNPEPIFIKNLENVQGDERDVILFSVGYGPDKEGKVNLNFGPLNREGGWRRLNVAVSRARYEMKVFSTLRSEQIDITRTASEGVASIKAFLEYAEKGRVTLGMRKDTAEANDSGFEHSLAEEIRKHGYEVHTNVGCSGYRIDVGIVNKEKPTEYILGVLCDGATYHAAKTAKDREIIQHEVLGLLGWTLHKVWSTDWWENRERVLSGIMYSIQLAVEAGVENAAEIFQIEQESVYHPDQKMVYNNNAGSAELKIQREVSTAKVYEPCDLGNVYTNSSDDFLQYHNMQKVIAQIHAVVEAEAPITRNLLARRILGAWGINKLGTRINAHFETILAQSSLKQTTSNDTVVFWNQTESPGSYTAYRVATADGKKRDADDLPPEEIANAIREILQHQISLAKDELIREASKLFGFARSGSNVEAAMRKGIYVALEGGIAKDVDNRIVYDGN